MNKFLKRKIYIFDSCSLKTFRPIIFLINKLCKFYTKFKKIEFSEGRGGEGGASAQGEFQFFLLVLVHG